MSINSKKEIRKKYKTMRDQMDQREVRTLSERICEHIINLDDFSKAEYIYAYYPLGNEADIRAAVEEAWRLGKRVAFPKVFGDEMRFFEIDDFSHLHPGTFGVMEPEENQPADWQQVLILVPGVAFDMTGNRMGFGKGYYDRYLEQMPEAVTVGIAYGLQIAEYIPTEPTDVRLNYVVTEEDIRKIDK